MSAGLENINTLPELREWLRVRVRWLRDWHMAPQDPKPIPSAFRDAILSMFRASPYPPPSDPTKVEYWLNEHIWRFSELTIHQVHDWLETHSVFGAPDWQGHDPLKDERILIDALEHLSALLNFVGSESERGSSSMSNRVSHKPQLTEPAKPWSAGDFLSKARELYRRLKAWHITDYQSPIQFVDLEESRRWVRLTFRDIVAEGAGDFEAPPKRSMQLFAHTEGRLDQDGVVGMAYENPGRDTDRSLTQCLLEDFRHHLDAAPSSPALDYLRGAFGQILDLPAWTVEEPPPSFQPAGGKRMVTGQEISSVILDAFADAAGRLLDLTAIKRTDAERPEGTAPGRDPAEGEQAEGTEEQTRQKRIASLKPAVRKAYLSFEAACRKTEKKVMEDWEAHKLLKEEGIPEDSQGELTDYQLPSEETWKRQIREARKELGEQKYTSRRGRQHGKSIVRPDQIEHPFCNDE